MKFLSRSVPFALVTVILLLTFSAMGGCGGDSGDENRFYRLLKLVPSELNNDNFYITLNDFASFHENHNISLTSADNQPISFDEYLEILSKKDLLISVPIGSYITGYGRFALVGPIKNEYVGYNFTCIDAEIQAGMPPNEFVVTIGEYNPQATRDAFTHQDEWPLWAVEAYTIEEYRGVTIHSWGLGLEHHMVDRICPPHIDNLGRARPLAITDGHLFYAVSVEFIQLLIDASQGKTKSLADLPEFAAIANGLSDLGCYTAIVGNESLVNLAPIIDSPVVGPQLKYFVAFGSGAGEDDKGVYMALVIYNENAEDARSNVSLLEQRIAETSMMIKGVPWSEVFADTEIWTEGNVLFAKLYTDSPVIYAEWVYAREPLLHHES